MLVHEGRVNTFEPVAVSARFHEAMDEPPGTEMWALVMVWDPVLLIVIVTRPPPFHEEVSAKEMPARHVPEAAGEDVPEDEAEEAADEAVVVDAGFDPVVVVVVAVGWTEDVVAVVVVVVVVVVAEADAEDGLDTPVEAHEEVRLHSHWAASAHVGEPPPPHATRL